MTADLDPERALALIYVAAARRPALEALWRLDVTLGAVLAGGRDRMISEIRLAWWREALERLDQERPPAEPALEALAHHVLPAGISGAELCGIEQGWAVLLEPGRLSQDDLGRYAELRGGRLFAWSARLLGVAGAPVSGAGEAWALIDLARRSGDPAEAKAALEAARARAMPSRWAAPARPLGMLAALARRDAVRGLPFEPQGSPRRMLRMLALRLAGR